MSAYLASYLAIAVSIRLLAGYLTIIEIGLLRSIGSLAIAGSVVWASGSGQRRGFLPANARNDILRSVLHLAGSLALIVGGFVSQAALANASRHGTPLQLCSADTLRVPLITLAAYLILAELPPKDLLLPGLLVLCGVIVASLPQQAGSRVRQGLSDMPGRLSRVSSRSRRRR